MRNRWPIDESVLSEKAKGSEIQDEVKSLCKEFQGLNIRHISVLGSAALANILRGRSEKKEGKLAQTKHDTSVEYTVTNMFSWMKDKDLQFAGAYIACWSRRTYANLLRPQSTEKNLRALSVLMVVLVLCIGALLVMRPDILSRVL